MPDPEVVVDHPRFVLEEQILESAEQAELQVTELRALVLGEGVHSVRCALTPTRNGLAYAGNAMGREIVYERSREQLQADLDRLNPNLRKPMRR